MPSLPEVSKVANLVGTTTKITKLWNGPKFSHRHPTNFFLLPRPPLSMNSNCCFSLPAADSKITKESLLNKAANKRLLEEQIAKSLVKRNVFYFADNVKSLVVILCYCSKKKYIFNQDQFTSAVQASKCQQQWWQHDAAREPREFVEFVNEKGWDSDMKIWAHSTVRCFS